MGAGVEGIGGGWGGSGPAVETFQSGSSVCLQTGLGDRARILGIREDRSVLVSPLVTGRGPDAEEARRICGVFPDTSRVTGLRTLETVGPWCS